MTENSSRKNNIYENVTMCKQCGGDCCKRCSCCFSPTDFEEISFDYLKMQLEKGYISIDTISSIYVLRVRNEDAPIVDTEVSKQHAALSCGYTPCILLTETGCKLDFAHRPFGGKMYIPDFNGFIHCYTKYPDYVCTKEWKPYQDILKKLYDYFSNLDFPCYL